MGWLSNKMPDDRRIRKHFWRNQKEKKTGGPNLRWLDCIEMDMMSMGIQRGRNKAEDSSLWAIFRMGAVDNL